jgi:hypothetical protein
MRSKSGQLGYVYAVVRLPSWAYLMSRHYREKPVVRPISTVGISWYEAVAFHPAYLPYLHDCNVGAGR